MGTKGLVVFKYKGIYYIFYNHSDSYISYLCNNIVIDLRDIIKNNKLAEITHLISRMPLQKKELDGTDNHYHGLMESILYPNCFRYHTSHTEPSNSIFMEYVYIIDFDNNLFIIKMYENLELQFDLLNLPSNLIQLAEDHLKNYNDNNYEIFKYQNNSDEEDGVVDSVNVDNADAEDTKDTKEESVDEEDEEDEEDIHHNKKISVLNEFNDMKIFLENMNFNQLLDEESQNQDTIEHNKNIIIEMNKIRLDLLEKFNNFKLDVLNKK
jgi:hypothetical protein